MNKSRLLICCLIALVALMAHVMYWYCFIAVNKESVSYLLNNPVSAILLFGIIGCLVISNKLDGADK